MNEPDWLDDDSMSEEETRRRFQALKPIEVTGPQVNGVVIRGHLSGFSPLETAGVRVEGRGGSVVFRGNHTVTSVMKIA